MAREDGGRGEGGEREGRGQGEGGEREGRPRKDLEWATGEYVLKIRPGAASDAWAFPSARDILQG